MALAGTGVPLPYPQNNWPSYGQYGLTATGSAWSNEIYLSAGEVFNLPPGRWAIMPDGTYIFLQILDPVTQTWIPVTLNTGYVEVNSDGINYRLINGSGIPKGVATVTAKGTGYAASSTTVTTGTGTSTWRALIDGTVGTITIGTDKGGTTGGTNWTLPPTLIIQAPPAGGIQCLASATVSAGAINAVTLQAAYGTTVTGGAGYLTAPGVLVLPNPNDPNIGSLTIPAITTALATAVGAVTGVLQTYQGAPVASETLTISGAGSSATATIAVMAANGHAATCFVQWLGSGA